MLFLSKNQRVTLTSVCDTILPAVPGDEFGQSASELGVVKLAEKSLAERDDEVTRKRLKLLLNLLQWPAFNLFVCGCWGKFTALDVAARTKVLNGLASSRFNLLRGAFHSLKQLVTFLAYTHAPPLGSNPYWGVFGYQGRALSVNSNTDRLTTVIPDGSQDYECDVLVIGSGAGGAVVASELAAEGHDVIVVEKGKYFHNSDLPATELTGMRDLYECRGSLTTVDRGLVVLAGSTLGGGTTVNWMTCLAPPQSLLEEWHRDFGFEGATSAEFAASVEHIQQRINVTKGESDANPQNDLIERGCKALGYDCSVIARNVSGCERCDFCGFGCRYGAKQDTRSTFLVDAAAHGARLFVQSSATKITQAHGLATGAILRTNIAPGEYREVKVRAQVVVVAAGAINSPALLMRSGLTNRQLGRNLHLHPCGAVYAYYRSPMYSWIGAPQTRICEEFANLDGRGYGVRLEASPAHPGLWALGLPWRSGPHHRDIMKRLPHFANSIVLTRDRFGGRVKIDKGGRPRIHYKVHPYDARHISIGVEKALRVHLAAGAQTLYGPTNESLSFTPATDTDFEGYLARVTALGVKPNHFGLFCAHQMSSCRIGSGPATGVVSPEGETYELSNLFVADGSVFPTASGVNPMITIMSTAHHIAQHIKSRMDAIVGGAQPKSRVRRAS